MSRRKTSYHWFTLLVVLQGEKPEQQRKASGTVSVHQVELELVRGVVFYVRPRMASWW